VEALLLDVETKGIPTNPPHPEVPFASAKGLEGAIQNPSRSLKASFEAATRHLRMR
jgi:hypothetical protein